MTVSSSVNKVSYAGNGSTTVFSVGFYFFQDSDLLVVLRDSDGIETVKTLTTDYTVTGAGNPAGGSITMNVAPASGETLVIAREVPLTQQTDYLANDPFPAETHERALDKLTMATQQLQEQVNRSAKLPISDPASADSLVADLVRVADSINQVDTVANNIASVNTTATNIANVNTVAGISGNVTTVSGIAANVTTVAGISANVTTVAGISANVTTVAGIAPNVTTVANNDANVTIVATDLAGSNTIGTVAGDIADVSKVAADIAAVVTVAADLSEPVSEIEVVAGSITNVNTVGTNIAYVNTVAGISANVTTVAGISANVTTVAGISANVTTVAGISANVNTVAGISADVTAVAGDATDIGTVATDLAGTDTIGTVAAGIANVNTVAGSISNVNTVATNITDVGTVAGIDSDITTVADISTNVTTVAGVAGDLNAVALTVAPVEAMLPINFDIPNLWWDTGDRLLSGASERMIISNWQVTSLFDTEDGAWYDTYDTAELGGATTAGDNVPSFGDKSGNSNDATGENVLYATVPRPALYNNKVSSRMVVDLPYLGNNCTIGYCSDQGVTILTGRTVGGPTDILHDRYLFGYVAIDRALTAQETLRLTQYLESRKFGYVAPAEYDGAVLLEDGFSLLMENDDRVDLEGVITWPLSV